MIGAVIWISLLSYSLYYHWAYGIEILYIIRPLHIFFAFFFPTFYSRNRIMHRLNASYLLLKETQYSNNITVPLLFIFSPLTVHVFTMVSITTPGDHWRILEFFAFLSLTATFTIKSSICSLCFATVFIIRDINRRLSRLHIDNCTSADMKALTKMLSCAYEQADLISEAFSPFLALFIFSYTIWVLVLFAEVSYSTVDLEVLLVIGFDAWSIVVLCASSQYMDFEVSALLYVLCNLINRKIVTHLKICSLLLKFVFCCNKNEFFCTGP